jgi:hypothetical protein
VTNRSSSFGGISTHSPQLAQVIVTPIIVTRTVGASVRPNDSGRRVRRPRCAMVLRVFSVPKPLHDPQSKSPLAQNIGGGTGSEPALFCAATAPRAAEKTKSRLSPPWRRRHFVSVTPTRRRGRYGPRDLASIRAMTLTPGFRRRPAGPEKRRPSFSAASVTGVARGAIGLSFFTARKLTRAEKKRL